MGNGTAGWVSDQGLLSDPPMWWSAELAMGQKMRALAADLGTSADVMLPVIAHLWAWLASHEENHPTRSGWTIVSGLSIAAMQEKSGFSNLGPAFWMAHAKAGWGEFTAAGLELPPRGHLFQPNAKHVRRLSEAK